MTPLISSRQAPIAAVQGASSRAIQGLLADFAAKLVRDRVRVAGVVEISEPAPSGACGNLALRDLSSGALYSISQNLGSGSTACNLDPGGLAAACGAVERALARGPDLVVISKFGKQEAARGGLCDAFRAAVAAGIPLLTAVNPSIAESWDAFAGPLVEILPASGEALECWWERCVESSLRAAAE